MVDWVNFTDILFHFCNPVGDHKCCFQELYISWYASQPNCSVLSDMWQDLGRGYCPQPGECIKHFTCVSGKLPGLCRITIGRCSIQPLDCVRSEHKICRKWANFCPLSSAPWGAAGAALTARLRVLAKWVLKMWNCFPDSHVSPVVASNSACHSSNILVTAGLPLACIRFVASICILESLFEWLHIWGKKCWAFRSITSFCWSMILARWSHTLCINSIGSVYQATFNNSSSHSGSFSWDSLNKMLPLCMSRSTCIVSGSSLYTQATHSCFQILMPQQKKHIYLCQLYESISEWVTVWGTTTISRIPRDLAIAVAAACCVVQYVPVMLYPLQSRGSSRLQGNQLWPPK